MKWFQDVNWSGVENIVQLLKEIDDDILLPYIEQTIKKY